MARRQVGHLVCLTVGVVNSVVLGECAAQLLVLVGSGPATVDNSQKILKTNRYVQKGWENVCFRETKTTFEGACPSQEAGIVVP